MATNTSKLTAAYKQYAEALDKQGKAQVAEYNAKKAEAQDDTRTALQNAYIQNERAALRQGQADRAAGITGGLAKSETLARDNAYLGTRTAAKIGEERTLGGYDRAIAREQAQTYASKSANDINRETALSSIEQNDAQGVRSVYAAMLSNKNLPTDTAEAQKMAASLGVPLSSLQAYIKYAQQQGV